MRGVDPSRDWFFDESAASTKMARFYGRTHPSFRRVYITVLHRLFVSGSDHAAERWYRKYALRNLGKLNLQHFYRRMDWLGKPLPADQQLKHQPLRLWLRKDLIEAALFHRRLDLFTDLQLVFIDTTSIYFEGQRGESTGNRGYSKDHRPDLKQLIVVVVMEDEGHPVGCEMLPGNTANIKTLLPVVDRLRERFDIRDVCVVADHGMISEKTIPELMQRGIGYVLGARGCGT